MMIRKSQKKVLRKVKRPKSQPQVNKSQQVLREILLRGLQCKRLTPRFCLEQHENEHDKFKSLLLNSKAGVSSALKRSRSASFMRLMVCGSSRSLTDAFAPWSQSRSVAISVRSLLQQHHHKTAALPHRFHPFALGL